MTELVPYPRRSDSAGSSCDARTVTLTLRMRDDLKRKAQQMARDQGVSLNGYINATLAAAIAQQETLAYFSDRLRDVDPEALHRRVLKFMRQSRAGEEPTVEDVQRAMGG